MTELVQFTWVLPTYFTGEPAQRKILRLEDYIDIPDPVYIHKVLMWAQDPLTGFPTGCGGDATLAVDPKGQYITAANWPAYELPTDLPQALLKTIGKFEATGGCARGQTYDLPVPVAYRKGQHDCIIYADEFVAPPAPTPAVPISMYVALYLGSDTGDIAIPTGTAGYDLALDSDVAGNSDISIRQMITGLTPGPLGKLRIHISALASGMPGTSVQVPGIQHASVGVRNGATANTVNQPVELQFGFNSWFLRIGGVSLPANQGCWSNWVNFPFSNGDTLAFTFDMFSGNNANKWAYRATSPMLSYSSNVRSYNSAAMNGTPTLQNGRTHIIDKIEVR